uniref:LAGLIDADG endonuclease n=1 Tax=Macrolepiota fuliginosa TaxID=201230 RepID=A0A5Q0N342_9AGAR|nr:LAGLIDADG endonuclease [Macrolepiota fuliginosa]QFZ98750.1 LAGLIDADG endonuclease [Macrolepiota fuliginosa]
MLKRDIKNVNYLYFLGGFVEGEGSMSVSVTIHKDFKYGVNIQPIFNVTQHKKGLDILNSFKELFVEGSVLQKSGSPDIFVYTLKGYKKIIKEVLPFLETYVCPFSCKIEEYSIFRQIVLQSSEGKQKDKETLIELVKLAYALQGKGKTRKRELPEILAIIEDKNAYFNTPQPKAVALAFGRVKKGWATRIIK